MVTRLKRLSLKDAIDKKANHIIDNIYKCFRETYDTFKGRIVKQKHDYFLVSFDSVTNAVLCALEIQAAFKNSANIESNPPIKMKIGLSAGVPVSQKEGLFEDTIKMAEYLCDVVKGDLVVSTEVKELYESENLNISLDKNHMNVLPSSEEDFLNKLMDHIEREWTSSNLNIDDLSKSMGYSKSQLYRKMISITGKSPNRFIRDYRLNKALELLNKKSENISEVAYETGFNTPAYFSKCFQDAFGILPSHYLKSFHS